VLKVDHATQLHKTSKKEKPVDMKKMMNILKHQFTITLILACVSFSANATGTKVHDEKFPTYFNTVFSTTINTNFAADNANWSAWSNNASATVVVVDYAQYSAPCALKMVNYATCSATSTAISRATSPVINMLAHLTAGVVEMDFYTFSYEAISTANSRIAIEFYNGATGNWVKQWDLTGTQFNTQIGLNNWKKITLNIPAAYRRADFQYRVVGTMNAGVCGNQYIYFDNFVINSSLNLLPVELEFSAREQGSQNLLQWTNFNEGGNRDYSIERSQDGRNFSAIGTVIVQSGTGSKFYSFTDRTPLAGINYYRLAVTTLSGAKVYSAVKVVSQKGTNAAAGLFPNPVADFANITIPTGWQQSSIVIQVVAADGKMMVQEQRKQSAATEWIGLQKLTAGAYRAIIRNTATGETNSISFVKR
jgi:Secretion system C-terminal sorting domain